MTDYLWLSILLQTLELPIGIICCCVPNLKPAAAEISDTISLITNRLLCCFPRIRGPKDQCKGPLPYQSSEDDPKSRFVRLNDRSIRVATEMSVYYHGHEAGIEPGFHEGKPTFMYSV